MISIRVLLLLGGISSLAQAGTAESYGGAQAPQAATSCVTTGHVGVSLRNEILASMQETDSSSIFARDSIFHIPVVDTATVSFVADASQCDQAVVAINQLRQAGGVTLRVYLLDLGGIAYAAKDPDMPFTVFILNRQFAVTGGYSGP